MVCCCLAKLGKSFSSSDSPSGFFLFLFTVLLFSWSSAFFTPLERTLFVSQENPLAILLHLTGISFVPISPTTKTFRPLLRRLSRTMAQFENQELEYMVDDYYDISDFEDDLFEDTDSSRTCVDESLESDFEDELEMNKPKTDTSAFEARNGKDIQGIPWERLNFTRDKYRETRLKQYKNYENLSPSHEVLEKECKHVEKGHEFYDFQFNTRLVKSTIVHFQL